MSKLLSDQFTLPDKPPVTLYWPDDISESDLSEVEEWIGLLVRRWKRFAAAKELQKQTA